MAQAPGSLITIAPSRTPASQTQNVAPAGSARTAKRPAGSASVGATATVPPAAAARSAASSR